MVQAALKNEPTIIRVEGGWLLQKVFLCGSKRIGSEPLRVPSSYEIEQGFQLLQLFVLGLGLWIWGADVLLYLASFPKPYHVYTQAWLPLASTCVFLPGLCPASEAHFTTTYLKQKCWRITSFWKHPYAQLPSPSPGGIWLPWFPVAQGRLSSSVHSRNQPDNTTLLPAFPSLSPFPILLPVIPRVTSQINDLPSNPCHGDPLLGTPNVIGSSASFFHRLIQGTPTFAPPKQNSFNK